MTTVMDSKLILCVEDKQELREDIAEEFRNQGYNVLEAENGEQALEILSRVTPDIIISDVKMPIIDGYELVSKIRSQGGEKGRIPFIFLSSFTDRQLVLEGYKYGIEDYVFKPIDYNILVAKIKAIMKRTEKIFKPNND